MLTNVQTHRNYHFSVRNIAICAMLAAVATVLMFLSFPVPLMPGFIKMDLSELPALLAAFTLGPVEGIIVCLVKNLVNLIFTTTSGVGELCNFLMGATMMIPAGLIYKKMLGRAGAVLAAVAGAVFMALVSIPINYFISYPMYMNFMPEEVILGMYRAIWPGAGDLLQCLCVFNAPFTLVKGLISGAVVFFIYKPLTPVFRGKLR